MGHHEAVSVSGEKDVPHARRNSVDRASTLRIGPTALESGVMMLLTGLSGRHPLAIAARRSMG